MKTLNETITGRPIDSYPEPVRDVTHRVTVRAVSVSESAGVGPVDAFVLKHYYVHGRKPCQIATISGMTAGAVRVRLHRLREKIPALRDLET